MSAASSIRDINVKVLNLMSRNNQTRHIEWYETCKCKCRLDSSVCNNKQRWNENKCRCECKELRNKGRCDKGSIWNPSNCDCECNTSCDVEEYLDYINCKSRKKIVGELVKEYSKNINENQMIYNRTLNDYKKVCSSCVIYLVLLPIFFKISKIISSVFICFHWYLKKVILMLITDINANTETVVY